METVLIRNVLAADATGERVCDLFIADGKIVSAGPALKQHADRVIDGTGMAALPGLFDMHVHFRDPGQTHKEDLSTGCAAALAGGVTGVLCMPNTTPPMDNPLTGPSTVITTLRSRASSGASRVMRNTFSESCVFFSIFVISSFFSENAYYTIFFGFGFRQKKLDRAASGAASWPTIPFRIRTTRGSRVAILHSTFFILHSASYILHPTVSPICQPQGRGDGESQ